MEPIAYYNCWRTERGNSMAQLANHLNVAANAHVFAVLNPRTAIFGVLHSSEATARPDATGVIGPGEPFLVARLHPAHCSCGGSNRVERA